MTTEKSRNAENFSARLLSAMDEAKISQADLARRLDTAWSTVDRWMKGSVPRRKMIQEIARTLCVASRWLETGEGHRSIAPALDMFAAEKSSLREEPARYRTKPPGDAHEAMFQKLAESAPVDWLLDRIDALAQDATQGDAVAAATISRLVPIVRSRIGAKPQS